MTHGTIRTWLETLKAIAEYSGLSLEQIADVFDANEALRAKPIASSTEDRKPVSVGPKGVQ